MGEDKKQLRTSTSSPAARDQGGGIMGEKKKILTSGEKRGGASPWEIAQVKDGLLRLLKQKLRGEKVRAAEKRKAPSAAPQQLSASTQAWESVFLAASKETRRPQPAEGKNSPHTGEMKS